MYKDTENMLISTGKKRRKDQVGGMISWNAKQIMLNCLPMRYPRREERRSRTLKLQRMGIMKHERELKEMIYAKRIWVLIVCLLRMMQKKRRCCQHQRKEVVKLQNLPKSNN
ncbi:hypothetical protein Goklo_000282 [Gossypium klotzschianum]|uniref:Uncharacterized protein n=1 Tax=Gossypium klotzschianum TaxID=34286 RepID=A0A7J8VWY7_9ROSI|nr:hypothetical protein [Gossypium klotzschianum]